MVVSFAALPADSVTVRVASLNNWGRPMTQSHTDKVVLLTNKEMTKVTFKHQMCKLSFAFCSANN